MLAQKESVNRFNQEFRSPDCTVSCNIYTIVPTVSQIYKSFYLFFSHCFNLTELKKYFINHTFKLSFVRVAIAFALLVLFLSSRNFCRCCFFFVFSSTKQ